MFISSQYQWANFVTSPYFAFIKINSLSPIVVIRCSEILVNIGSSNSLWFSQSWAVTWTSDDLKLTEHIWTNFNEIWIKTQDFLSRKHISSETDGILFRHLHINTAIV